MAITSLHSILYSPSSFDFSTCIFKVIYLLRIYICNLENQPPNLSTSHPKTQPPWCRRTPRQGVIAPEHILLVLHQGFAIILQKMMLPQGQLSPSPPGGVLPKLRGEEPSKIVAEEQWFVHCHLPTLQPLPTPFPPYPTQQRHPLRCQGENVIVMIVHP